MLPFDVPAERLMMAGQPSRSTASKSLSPNSDSRIAPASLRVLRETTFVLGATAATSPEMNVPCPAYCWSTPFAVALVDLEVALDVGHRRVGRVVVHEAGVDDQDADGTVRVVTTLRHRRVGPHGVRDGHGLVAGAGVDGGDVHDVVAADEAASRVALRLPERAQRARHRAVPAPVALGRVADPDPGDARPVGLRARPAHLVGRQARERGEVRTYGVLDDPRLLAVAGEDDALLVDELGGVVRPHRQLDVGHGALDLVELLLETLRCHGMSSPFEPVPCCLY